MNTSCVIRTTDVMDDYISQMDPDGEYLEHAFNLANARNWAEKQGHKYSDRVWNAARGAWDYIYSTSGMKSYNNMRKYANIANSTTNTRVRNTNIKLANQSAARFNQSILGKARSALNRVKAGITNGINNGMKRAAQFGRNLRAMPSQMKYNNNSEYYKSGASAQQRPYNRLDQIAKANAAVGKKYMDARREASQNDYARNREQMMAGSTRHGQKGLKEYQQILNNADIQFKKKRLRNS